MYFRSRFKAIVNALEDFVESGKSDEIVQCRGYFREFQAFTTVLMLVILDRLLTEVNTLSKCLQSSSILFTTALDLSGATVTTVKSMKSEATFEDIWKEAETLARTVSIAIPTDELDDASPERKRRKEAPRRLQDFVVLAPTVSREYPPTKESHRAIFHQIIDTFVAEISRRLSENDVTLQLLETSDPRSRNFLNKEMIKTFCGKFSRFGIEFDEMSPQLNVTKNLLVAKDFETANECLEYLLRMEEGFRDLVQFFKITLSFPVTSASCERSFNALKRIKSHLRSSMGAQRTSALSLLSIERDLTEILAKNPDQWSTNSQR